MRQLVWTGLMAVALLAAVPAAAQAGHFYEGQDLAWPAAVERRDHGVVLAFLRENGEVNSYFCQCNQGQEKRMNLDRHGKASIEAVFHLDLDSEGQTTFVLTREHGAYRLQAYRFERGIDRMLKVAGLQPALDRIVSGKKAIDEPQIRAALASLQLIDYSIAYQPTGVAHIDTLDHAQGKLVGYFNIDGDATVPAAGQPAFAYKKTFDEKDGHFLTVTYVLGQGWQGGHAPSYHIRFINRETEPGRFSGSQDGAAFEYDVGCCAGHVLARGQYARGKRTGAWQYEEPYASRSAGSFVDGKAEGPWTHASAEETTSGQMVNGQRTGRWEVSEGVEQWRAPGKGIFQGFDTFVKDRLHGPSERRLGGVLQWQGAYADGKKQGQWIVPGGGGAYADDVPQGPWKKATAEGGWQVLTMVQGQPDGKLEQYAADGKLELIEHYRLGVLDGTMESFYPDGTPRYQGNFANGKRDGAETLFYPGGATPQFHRNWQAGVLHGVSVENYRDGMLRSLGGYNQGRKVGRHQLLRSDGQLIEEKLYPEISD